MVPAKSLGCDGGGGPEGSTGWGAGAGAANAVGGELQRGDELSQLADLCSQFCLYSRCMCHYQVGIMQYLEHNLAKCVTIV